MKHRIGMVGLGRMGGNMARRIARAGLERGRLGPCRGRARRPRAAKRGVAVADTLPALVAALPAPRVLWLMLPAGAPTEATLAELRELLAPGDVVVDGGERLVPRQHAPGHGTRRRSACSTWMPASPAACGAS